MSDELKYIASQYDLEEAQLVAKGCHPDPEVVRLTERIEELEKTVSELESQYDFAVWKMEKAEAQLEKVRGYIQQNDDWEATTKETVRNIKQALACEPQNEILDIPYDRIDGGELDLYGKGEPKTFDELRVSAMIAEIKRLHIFEGYKLVEAFGGDYESPDDFVSASELNVLLEKYDG